MKLGNIPGVPTVLVATDAELLGAAELEVVLLEVVLLEVVLLEVVLLEVAIFEVVEMLGVAGGGGGEDGRRDASTLTSTLERGGDGEGGEYEAPSMFQSP